MKHWRNINEHKSTAERVLFLSSLYLHQFSNLRYFQSVCFQVFLQQIYRKNTKGFRAITNTRQENNYKENSAVQMKMNKSKINKSKINQKVVLNLAVVTLASPQMKRALEGPLRSVEPKFRVTCCECKILDSSSARGWGSLARDYIPS